MLGGFGELLGDISPKLPALRIDFTILPLGVWISRKGLRGAIPAVKLALFGGRKLHPRGGNVDAVRRVLGAISHAASKRWARLNHRHLQTGRAATGQMNG